MKHHAMLFVIAAHAFTCTAASAFEPGPHKPGLWEMRVQTEGHTMVEHVCFDATTDATQNAIADAYMKQHCTKNEMRQEGGKWIADSICAGSGTLHTVTTASGDSAYHTEGSITVDSQWLGPCKPGQKPGAIEIMR